MPPGHTEYSAVQAKAEPGTFKKHTKHSPPKKCASFLFLFQVFDTLFQGSNHVDDPMEAMKERMKKDNLPLEVLMHAGNEEQVV